MKQYLKETLPLESETERKRQRMVLTENFFLFCFAQNLFSLCARAAGEYMPILKPGNFKLVDGGEHDGGEINCAEILHISTQNQTNIESSLLLLGSFEFRLKVNVSVWESMW